MAELVKNKLSTRNRKALSMLTFVPIQPIWLAHCPAFQSENAQVVRASLNLLMAAFYGEPCGTIPNTVEALATLANTPKSIIAENLSVLCAGWKMGASSMSFEPMVKFAQRIQSTQADALESLQHATIVAMAAPDLFNSELLPEQGLALACQVGDSLQSSVQPFMLNPTKVPKLLPEQSKLSPELTKFLDQQGVSPQTHNDIWARFYDYHMSKGIKSPNWPAAFRHWFKNQREFSREIASGGQPSSNQTQNKTVRFSLGAANPQNPTRAERAARTTRSALESVGLRISQLQPNQEQTATVSSAFSFEINRSAA